MQKKAKEYHAKNRERSNKQKREHYADNRKVLQEKGRINYKKNRKKIRKRQREHYAKNREKIKSTNKKYRLENREKINKQKREQYANNSDKNLELKLRVFTVYSKRLSNSKIPCCACCGEKYSHEFLSIDHIKGRKLHGHKTGFGGIGLYHLLEKEDYPNGYQVLCHNCNFAKGKYGICPHKR